MKVSIITVCFNSELTIQETIESVNNQTHKNIEHIFIDGRSTDNTLRIISEISNSCKVISENDNGIYDAMNKGILLSEGDIICILNSDDVFFDDFVLENVVKVFKMHDVDAVYGNIVMCSEKDWVNKKVTRKWVTGTQKSFTNGWHPPHPALFVKKTKYQELGMFKPKYRISADFELMLRFFEVYKIKASYLNFFLVRMRMGGTSTRSIKNIIIGNINIRKSFFENGVTYNYTYPFFRAMNKLKQYFLQF